MLALGSGRTGNRRAHRDRTHRSGVSVCGTWIRLLVLALAMAWVGSVEATEPGGSAPLAIGSVHHVSYAAPNVGSHAAPESGQGAAGVFEAAPPLARGGALVATPVCRSSIRDDANAAATETKHNNADNR